MSERQLKVTPNPVVASLVPYSPGRPTTQLDLFLDANESLSPAPSLADAIADAAGATGLNRYPAVAELEARIAGSLGLDPAAVLVTAGADDALERALRSVCSPGRNVLLTTPSFEMLGRYARLAGAEVTELGWWSGDWPVDAALEAASGADVAAVAVVSPNNPTGAVISGPSLQRLATALPGALVLLDHAYAEFAETDLTRAALALPNVVVFRTFSKAWGAAGLRVGYAAGDPRVIGWMRCVGQPYAVAGPSVAAVSRLLDADPTPPGDRVHTVRRHRSELAALLSGLGAEVLPSEGNFLLARCAGSAWLRAALASLGISVRAFAGRPLLDGWIRITVPDDGVAFDRLADGVRAALAPEALLLDLDGVVADVSRSYKQAVAETAAGLGVAITPADVSRIKAGGNANNDWEVTRRLLAEAGVELTLEEVAERFERIYQGTPDAPGLHRHERPLITPAALAAGVRGLPVAIVTGRPRADAERFLAAHDFGDVVAALVTLEDAPSKPDPAPVRVALERLGVRHAWMVGDTPDDLRAARAAGVVPVAVLAPGEDRDTARAGLEAAGPAAVLDSLARVLEVLP